MNKQSELPAWIIINLHFDELGAGRSHHGVVGWDEPGPKPLYGLVVGQHRAMVGYCETCEEDGAGGETLVDFATIEWPDDHTDKAVCVRCGYDNATPDYIAAESRSKAASAIASAVFPDSFARYACRWCDNGEHCPRRVSDCPAQLRAALDAGIPLDVITGRASIRDYYTAEQIATMAGMSPERQDELDQELRDAGRGHLVRR